MKTFDFVFTVFIVFGGLGFGLFLVFREKDPKIRKMKKGIRKLSAERSSIERVLKSGMELDRFELFNDFAVDGIKSIAIPIYKELTLEQRYAYEYILNEKVMELEVLNKELTSYIAKKALSIEA